MMGNEELTIIVVSVLCVLIVIAAIIAVSVYFCCGSKNRRKPGRYQLPATESTNSQSSPGHQDEPAPKPLPKVGSSGLWMSKPIMHAQGPNDAYHQLKPNGFRKDPVMMREILSTPNVNQPTNGYIYQGNLRMYHSQQLPGLVDNLGRGAYFNEAFIYPSYVDAGLSHRSSMRFLEASGYYAAEQLSRDSYNRDVSRHQVQRDSSGARVSRNNGDLRPGSAKPSRFQQKPPQHEERTSRSIESEANSRTSSKNKSVSSSTASGAESVIERCAAVQEATKSAALTSAAPANDKVSEPARSRTEERPSHRNEERPSHRNEERPSHRNEDVRTQADGKTNAEIATPYIRHETDISLDNLGLTQEQRDIPSDQQSYVDSVSDVTDLESKGQKITTQAFEFLDTYISDVDDDMDRPKYYSGKS